MEWMARTGEGKICMYRRKNKRRMGGKDRSKEKRNPPTTIPTLARRI
jgi:hypothetical protein